MTSFIFTSGTSAPQTLVGGELGIIGAAATVSDASGGGAIVGVAAAGQPLDLIVHGQVYSLSATAIGFGGGLQSITIGATGIVSAAGCAVVASWSKVAAVDLLVDRFFQAADGIRDKAT